MRSDHYQYGVDRVDGNAAWELMRASASGDAAEARRLVATDAALVNAQYWYQFPIHFAVREGQTEIVQLLLNNGAEPGRSRYQYNSWQKLVVEAERRGYDDTLRVLESTLADRYGYSRDFEPVAQAIRDRDGDAIIDMLRRRPELAAGSDVLGQGALHWVGMTHQPELIDRIMALGAPIDRPRADGQTAAMLAMNGAYWYRRHRDLPNGVTRDPWPTVEALLAAGADYNLSIAIMRGDETRVQELLEARPALARQLDTSRQSYLYYAAGSKQLDIAEKLLALGADPNAPEALAPRGRALHEASSRTDSPMVRLLLAHGADPNCHVDSSGTCTHIATAGDRQGPGPTQVVAALREAGAVTPPYDMTAEELHDAIVSGDERVADEQFASSVFGAGDPDLLRRLLTERPEALSLLPIVGAWYPKSREYLDILFSHGVSPNLGDWFGKTWLHFCAQNGDVDAAARLLDHGADINAVEAEYRSTPLVEAAKQGHTEMAKFLLDRGADPNAPADAWARPLAWAVEAGHEAVVEALRERGAVE